MANIIKKDKGYALYEQPDFDKHAIVASLEESLRQNEKLAAENRDSRKMWELNKAGMEIIKRGGDLNKLNEMWRD